jgi:Fusaric acid resistance protein-like
LPISDPILTKAPSLVKDFTRIDKSAFNPSLGVVGGIFVVAPIVLAIAIHELALFCTVLGALLIALIEGLPVVPAGRTLLMVCFTIGAAMGMGTLVATAGPILSPTLFAVSLFVILLARGRRNWASVGTFTAVAFSLGIGLPGASFQEAGVRTIFTLMGVFWGVLGVELRRYAMARRKKSLKIAASMLPISQMSRAENLRSAFVLAIACALGFSLGYALGFPRDYWVPITILFTVRPNISVTITFTSLMAAGTLVGAAAAAAITILIGNAPYFFATLLLLIGFLLFSLRGVNFGIMQVFVSSFIIILLNIVFPGQWYLAIYRVVDVAIGIGISLATVELLGVFRKTSTWL